MRGTHASERLRVFFALWPDDHALAAVRQIAHEIARAGNGRAPRDENLHVTVAFVGEVASARLAALRDVGVDAARASRRFILVLDRIGGTAQGIAWLAPSAVPEELGSLRAALVDRLHASAFVSERRTFRPHVTLARNCERKGRSAVIVPVSWPASRLSLVASTLSTGGSRYVELDAWPLTDTPV